MQDALLTPLFLISALVGIIFLLAGWLMLKYPPKNINGLYGYRTPSSMKDQERWDFAQEYSAKEFVKMGVLLLILAAASLFIEVEPGLGISVGVGFTFLLVIMLFVKTEKAIKRKFRDSSPSSKK